MGLDIVEIVIRTEEFFVIHIENAEAACVRTVGDFYKLICAKLDVLPFELPVTSEKLPEVFRKHPSFPVPLDVLPWSPQTVWDSLVAILVDQQGLNPNEVLYHARFVEDLGVD